MTSDRAAAEKPPRPAGNRKPWRMALRQSLEFTLVMALYWAWEDDWSTWWINLVVMAATFPLLWCLNFLYEKYVQRPLEDRAARKLQQ
jgi:hypothetical protein